MVGNQGVTIGECVVGVAGDMTARGRLGDEAVALDFREDLGIEVGLDHRRHLELVSQPFPLQGLEGQPDGLHGHGDLDGKEFEKTDIVGGERFGARTGFLVGGDKHPEGSVLGDQRDGRDLLGVDPVVPGLGEPIVVDGRAAETTRHSWLWPRLRQDKMWALRTPSRATRWLMSSSATLSGSRMPPMLPAMAIGSPRVPRDGSVRRTGCVLSSSRELPGAQAETSGAEDRLVESIELGADGGSSRRCRRRTEPRSSHRWPPRPDATGIEANGRRSSPARRRTPAREPVSSTTARSRSSANCGPW